MIAQTIPHIRCGRCRDDKPATGEYFYRVERNRSRGGYHSYCKTCMTSYMRRRRESNLDERRAIERKAGRTQRLKKYGLTPQQYDALVESQGGVCAICGEPENIRPNLTVDHCHSTGKVRGLLCFSCNVSIGHLGDTPEMVRRAVEYLERTLS